MTRFLTILLILWIYTAYEASRLWPSRPHRAVALSAAFFLLMIGWQFVYRFNPQALKASWFRALAWAGSLALGIWTTFILISIPLNLIHLFHGPYYETLWGILGVSAAIAGLGWIEVLRGPRIREVLVPIAGLPKELDGFTIVQISDLHVGPTIRRGYVQKTVQRANALNPDVIAVTGDLADGEPEHLNQDLLPLGGLRAKSGIYYVTGNHEYYWGAEAWIAKARQLGFVPLINENRIIQRGQARVLIAGVTDVSAGRFLESHRSQPQKAISSNQECQLKILLAHRPETSDEAAPLGFDLQLSGHTHAGQFFPFNLLVWLAHKHSRGLSRHGRMWVYVNAGTGYWGPANRFGVASEISLIRLVGNLR